MPHEKDERTHTGELLKAGERQKSSQGGLLTTLASSMRWSWVSRLWTRRTDDFRSMLEAENKLMDVAKEYLKKEDDLRNIGKILNADRAERDAREFEARSRLANAERAYKERFQDNTISQKTKDHVVKRLDIEEQRIESERLEAEIRRLENEKRLEELRKPPEPPKKTTTRGRSPKQKRRAEVLKRYDTEIARIEAMKKTTAKAKATLIKAAEAEKEAELEKIEKEP
jgi:hypothetical protein